MSAALEQAVLRGLVQMTNEEYHAAPGISKTHLDVISNKSPLHYRHYALHGSKTAPAKEFGSAAHCVILEPNEFEHRYAVAPDVDRRTKIGKETYAAFLAENIGKDLIDAGEYEKCLYMRDAIHSHPHASGLLTGGLQEQTYFASDPETGELIKCRFDYLIGGISGIAVDLKSAVDASEAGFGKSATKFRYDLQPAWYFDVLLAEYGTRPEQFVWIAIEKEPPFAIGIYYATEEDIQAARVIARRDFMRILDHKRRDYWPDYGAEIKPLKLASWKNR